MKLMIRRCTPPCASGWLRRLVTLWRRRQGEHDGGDGGSDGGDGGDGADGGDCGHGDDYDGGGVSGEQGGGVQDLDSSWFLMLLLLAGSCTEVQ